jgi:hypothetical protein
MWNVIQTGVMKYYLGLGPRLRVSSHMDNIIDRLLLRSKLSSSHFENADSLRLAII